MSESGDVEATYDFSEEEEELYVAANPSDDEAEAAEGTSGLQLSNVTVFRSQQAGQNAPAEGRDAFRAPTAAWAGQRIPQDGRVLILFDLNGVLVHHTFNGRTHKHYLRPGVHHLLRLLPHYRLGVYSSATFRTVQRAIVKLNEDISNAIDGEDGLEGAAPLPPGGLFDVVLCRDHCVLARDLGLVRVGGKPWDTLKPLGKYFSDLSRVVLVDDSPHKSMPDEVGNMLIVPPWEGPAGLAGRTAVEEQDHQVDVLQHLVDGLVEALHGERNGERLDVRLATQRINEHLVGLVPMSASIEQVEAAAKNIPPPPGLAGPGGAPIALTRPGAAPSLPAGQPHQQPGHSIPSSGPSWREPWPPTGPPAPAHNWERHQQPVDSPLQSTLRSLTLAKVQELGHVGGATLVEVQALLHARCPKSFELILKRSGKRVLEMLHKNGTLRVLENVQGSERYALSHGTAVPPASHVDEIEHDAFTYALDLTDHAARALVVWAVAELHARPGVPRSYLIISMLHVLKGAPPLHAAFHTDRDLKGQCARAVKLLLRDAQDSCCLTNQLSVGHLPCGSTPDAVLSVQLTQDLPPAGDELMAALVVAAATEVSYELARTQPMLRGLQQGAGAPPPVAMLGGNGSNMLPVFQDRGAPAAVGAPNSLPGGAGPAADGAMMSTEGAGALRSGGDEGGPPVAFRSIDREWQSLVIGLGLRPDCEFSKKDLRRLQKGATLEEVREKRERKKAKKRRREQVGQDSGEDGDEMGVGDEDYNEDADDGGFEDAGEAAKGMEPLLGGGAPVRPARHWLLSAGGASEVSAGVQAYTPLHHEVASFASTAAPTQEEAALVHAAVQAVDAAARQVWPDARAVLFGSQATGLALPGSDLDIVVLNVGPQIQRAGTGFTMKQRKTLVGLLRRLLNSLHRHSGNLEKAEVIGARVPILKCMMRFPGAPEALPVDISLGVVNGASLVVFLRRQVIALPPLRPLVLAVKALLRDRGLNEVFTGGVGSYAVVNLVVAHLQEQGYSIDPPFPEPLSGKKSKKAAAADAAAASERVAELLRGDMEQQTLTFLQRLAAGEVGTVGPRSPGFDSQGSPIQQTAGQQAPPAQPARVSDLGMLLWGFFERFGAGFDYVRRAVSVRNGGIVTKGAFAVGGKPWLLAVEDPQEPGKDICSGSYRAHELREEFVAASDLLAEACEDLEANMRSGGSGANEPDLAAQAAQRTQQGTSILGLLIDLQAAVGRGPEAAAARAALEQRAAAVRDEVLQYRTAAAMKRSWSDAEDERPAKRRKGERRGAGVIGHGAPVRPGKAPKRVVMSGGKPRGSKNRRAVEAQWKDRRGQYFEADDFIGGRRPGGGSDGGHGSATPKRGRKRNASIAPGTATPMLKVKGKGKKAREKRRQQKKEQRRWQGGQ